jgi:hypothetical protein
VLGGPILLLSDGPIHHPEYTPELPSTRICQIAETRLLQLACLVLCPIHIKSDSHSYSTYQHRNKHPVECIHHRLQSLLRALVVLRPVVHPRKRRIRHGPPQKRAQRLPPTPHLIHQPPLHRHSLQNALVVRLVLLLGDGIDVGAVPHAEEAVMRLHHGERRAAPDDVPRDPVDQPRARMPQRVQQLGLEARPPPVDVALHDDNFGVGIRLDQLRDEHAPQIRAHVEGRPDGVPVAARELWPWLPVGHAGPGGFRGAFELRPRVAEDVVQAVVRGVPQLAVCEGHGLGRRPEEACVDDLEARVGFFAMLAGCCACVSESTRVGGAGHGGSREGWLGERARQNVLWPLLAQLEAG